METFLSIGGFVTGILGLILAYVFYRLALRLKEPYWSFRNFSIIRDYISEIAGLEVVYNAQKVESLSVGRLLFWNKGSETIQKADLETINPLKIQAANGVKILSTKILAINNQSSQFSVEPDNSGDFALIKFDYLDKDQGAVIQVIHTGKERRDITVVGSVKGVKKITNKTALVPKSRMMSKNPLAPGQNRRLFPQLFMGGVMGVIYAVGGVYVMFAPPGQIQESELAIGRFAGFAVFLLGGLLAVMSFRLFRLTVVAPKGLEEFDE